MVESGELSPASQLLHSLQLTSHCPGLSCPRLTCCEAEHTTRFTHLWKGRLCSAGVANTQWPHATELSLAFAKLAWFQEPGLAPAPPQGRPTHVALPCASEWCSERMAIISTGFLKAEAQGSLLLLPKVTK